MERGSFMSASTSSSSWAPAQSGGKLWGSSGSVFTSFAAQASCDYAPAADLENDVFFRRFKAAFNPKYDLPSRPSHRRFLQPQNLLFIMARRVGIDLYLALAADHMANLGPMLEDGDDEDCLEREWPSLDMDHITGIVERSAPEAVRLGVIEICVGVIRIAYQKMVYDRCNTRLRWKMLKGALASALRKYARFGVLAGRRVWYTLARSAILQSAAELTFCLCTLPASRQYDLRSRAPRAIARAVIAETGITGCRLLMSTAGQTCCLGLAFFWAWLFGYQVDGDVWAVGEGGKEPAVRLYFQWSAALGASLSELALGHFVTPQLRAWARKGNKTLYTARAPVIVGLHGLD